MKRSGADKVSPAGARDDQAARITSIRDVLRDGVALWKAPGRVAWIRPHVAVLLSLALFLIPVVAYWPTIFHYYGLRDGYSNLREAHEEPLKLINFCASHARPIYGWLLAITYSHVDTIHGLSWVRMCSALMLGALALWIYRFARGKGWSRTESFLLGSWVTLVPSSQVVAGWSIGWPYLVAVMLSVAAYQSIDSGIINMISKEGGMTRIFIGILLIVVSAFIYQPSTLFYFFPLTLGYLVLKDSDSSEAIGHALMHLIVLITGLALAYFAILILYSHGIFVRSGRVAFDPDFLSKLRWYFSEPLPNALSPFALNDDNHRGRIWYLASASSAAVLLLSGAVLEWRRAGIKGAALWIALILVFPLGACSISIIAAERYATYRTIFATTSVLIALLIYVVRELLGRFPQKVSRTVAIIVIGTAFVLARQHAYNLLAVPQGNEWFLILEGAKRVDISGSPKKVFVIEPQPTDTSTVSIYHDEFGSLSSNSEWVPKEMFKRAMHDLHPDVGNVDQRYVFQSGQRLPREPLFDVVVDLRRLRTMRRDD